MLGSADKSIKLWDMDTMEHLSTISEGIVSPIVSMDLSVDDTFLVIGKKITKSYTLLHADDMLQN